MDIVEFLTARLDEDEAAAREAAVFYDNHDAYENGVEWSGHEGVDTNRYQRFWLVPHLGVINHVPSGLHIVRHNPRRVLAEVKAKRRVMERHTAGWRKSGPCLGCNYGPQEDEFTEDIEDCPELRDLAAPYADHPDYNPTWAVS